MSQLGIDYASVDGNSAPDFVKAKNAGVQFVIIRKSYILHDPAHRAWHLAADQAYARDVAHARAAGLTVGSYGFFAFDKGAPSAPDQVAALLHAAGDVVRGVDLPYCIDVEFPGRGIADTGRTQAEAFAFLLELVAEVRKQAGVSPLIYTSHVQWHDDNGLGGPDNAALDGCPLWVKTPYRLRAGQPLDAVAARLPHVGSTPDDPNSYWRVPLPWERQWWWIQQCQGDAVGLPGFDATVDINHFHELSASSTSEAPRIRWLQRQLCVVGKPYSGPLNVTGIWDTDTEYALRAFQVAHGLPVTGLVNIATFASLCW